MLRHRLTIFIAACVFLLHYGASAGEIGGAVRGAGLRHEKEMRSYGSKKLKQEGSENFRFINSKTAEYRVKSLPDVRYDIGEMYSGLVPIDEKKNYRAFFFVFQPTTGKPVDEITVWLNGGPGCSSLNGFLQENGRFLWQPGTFLPIENLYSWVNLTNMLWVEFPIGTGFSTGEITAKTEEEIAQDFVNFFENFQKIFGIKNFKIYVSGESYAGRYVPYISAAMLERQNKTHFDLRGALLYDPSIGNYEFVQSEVPAVPFVRDNQNLFNFNKTFMDELEGLDKFCGYAEYRDRYFRFPPRSPQPSLEDAACSVSYNITNAATSNNPCFNIYEISDHCPILWSVLGPVSVGSVSDRSAPKMTYFNRSDVKAAMHAPDVDWLLCSGPVFAADAGSESQGDSSADPIQHVLPKVIEATNRVLIGNGDLDMIILTNGTLLSIQNMTWNGKLGFQRQPGTPIEITLPDLQYGSDAEGDPGQGIMGIQHFERGLMWVETFLCGHMQPQYQPRVSYRHLEWLLGRVEEI